MSDVAEHLVVETPPLELPDGAAVYRRALLRGLKPPPKLTVSQWADEHRYLSQKASAEPGRYRVDRTPYLRQILDDLSADSSVEEVVFKKGAQVGASEAGNCWIGYIIDYAPGPTLAVLPTVDMAKRTSKQRIDPMIEVTPRLKERVKDARSRDSGNTQLAKEFTGGFLIMTGANSATGLRSMPAKNLFMDEEDGYPADVDGEGSPAELARRRTATFSRRKIFRVSTPTIEGASAISVAFEETDQRYYFVPCPHCKAMQRLKWDRIRWEKDSHGRPLYSSVRYHCEACEEPIAEHQKTWMLAAGEWRATKPAVKGGKVVGYHLSALYSPVGWFSWADAVEAWHKAQGRQDRLRVFVNTVLGEAFALRAEDAPDWRRLYEQRENLPHGVVPARACLLTAAVDVQKDRLELLVVGWAGKEAWTVDRAVLVGDTQKAETWRQLDPFLDRDWPHETGAALRIRLCLVDSGFNTTSVYEYVRKKNPRQVYAIKGHDKLSTPIGQPKVLDIKSNGKKIRRGIRLWPVGSSLLKGDIYGRLKQDRPTEEELARDGFPEGFIHFAQFDEEFFRQLVAEQLIVIKKKSGHAAYQWVKTYARNEALDLMTYNLAAWYGCGAHRMSAAQWASLAREVGAAVAPDPGAEEPSAATVEPPQTAKPPPPAPPPRVATLGPSPKRPNSFW
jgi:phage terminase large subunit GpA-like protein